MERKERREFIKKAGLGAAFMAAITAVPGKLFSNSKKNDPDKNVKQKNIRVNIHPNAVQRNTRGKSNE